MLATSLQSAQSTPTRRNTMGWIILVVGLLFLLAGLVISLWEAFRDIGQQVDGIAGRDVATWAEGPTELLEAIAKLLEAFAKLAVGIQLSLIGLVLTYFGLRILHVLPS
jgi:hypothetical protein